MARTAQELQVDGSLRMYLKGLYEAAPPRRVRSPGGDVRTCANCGRTTSFRLDPDGVWSTCSSCGRFA